MTKQDFLKRLLAAARAFRVADDLATKEDTLVAFNNTGVLAGQFAKLVGLPTDERYWDMSGRCPMVNAIMVVGYCNAHVWSVQAVETAWQQVLASNASTREPVSMAA